MATRTPSLEEVAARARQAFAAHFRRDAAAVASAPGRVNIIGEHTDYNDGFVLPMALPMWTVAAGAWSGTDECTVVSVTDDQVLKTKFPAPTAGTPLQPGEPAWANYVKGVVANFPDEVRGFELALVSTVPMGGGVSSSAALEVAVFTLLEALTGKQCDLTAKALACQKAEHQFAGMPCGIMDQFISTMGKEGNALLVDCRSLQSTLVPLADPDLVVLVINSNVRHKLTGSEYSTRRSQCQHAAVLLSKPSLRELRWDDLKDLRKMATDPVVARRAQHVVAEIARTEQAAKCLISGDYKRVGELMYESHASLRDLFEVSCPELDALVDATRGVPGVLGSRMTGGGFGGCTVTLVKRGSVENVIDAIKSKYSGHPTMYICRPVDGAKILSK